MRKNPFRLSKKETGEVSIQEGKWKIEVKERFRLIGIITAAFTAIFAIIFILFPYLAAAVIAIYAITVFLLSGFMDALQWSGRKLIDGGKWIGTWCIRQPIRDFRYGRKQRKEVDDAKVYGK